MLLTAHAHVGNDSAFTVQPYRHPHNFVTVSVGELTLFFQDDAKLIELRDALDAYLADQAKSEAA